MLLKRLGNAALMLVCKRSPRTSRRTTLSRHAPQYRGPASVQQLLRQPRRSSTCEVCAWWGGLSAAGICTRDAMHAYGEPKRHARTRASVCVCPRSAAPAPWPEQGCQIRSRSFEGAIIHENYSCGGSFRVNASHGAQVLRVCAPCLASYEPSAPHKIAEPTRGVLAGSSTPLAEYWDEPREQLG